MQKKGVLTVGEVAFFLATTEKTAHAGSLETNQVCIAMLPNQSFAMLANVSNALEKSGFAYLEVSTTELAVGARCSLQLRGIAGLSHDCRHHVRRGDAMLSFASELDHVAEAKLSRMMTEGVEEVVVEERLFDVVCDVFE